MRDGVADLNDSLDPNYTARVKDKELEELDDYYNQGLAPDTAGAPAAEPSLKEQFNAPMGGTGDKVTPAEDFARGAVRGTENLVAGAGRAMQTAGIMFADYKTRIMGEAIATDWSEKAARQPKSEAAGEGQRIWDNPRLFLSPNFWAATIGESVPVIAASFIPGMAAERYIEVGGQALKWTPTLVAKLARIGGAVSGGSVGGVLTGANTFEVVKQKGGTDEEAARASAFMGLVGTAIASLQFGAMFNAKGAGGKAGLGAASGLLQWLTSPTEALVVGNDVIEGWKQGLDAAVAGMGLGAVGGLVAHGIEGSAGKAPKVSDTAVKGTIAGGPDLTQAPEGAPKMGQTFTPKPVDGEIAPAGEAKTAPTPDQLRAAIPEGTELRVNLKYIDANESVKRVMANLERLSSESLAEHRATKGHEKTVAESKSALSLDEMLTLPPDRALNEAEMAHLQDTAVRAAEYADEIMNKAEQGDPEALSDWVQVALRAQILGEKNEIAGRTGARALEIRKLMSKGERGESLERINEVGKAMGDQLAKNPEVAIRRIKALKTGQKKSIFWRNLANGAAAGQDVFFESWINAMLSSPATHVVNALSNSLALVWAVNERALAALPRGSNVSVYEAPTMYRGLVEGFGDAVRLSGEALAKGESLHGESKIGTRANERGIRARGRIKDTPLGKAIDLIGEGVRLPSRFLLGSDEFFYQINYRMELKAQSLREGLAQGLQGKDLAEFVAEAERNPSTAIQESAKQFALMQTFTNELTPFGKKAQALFQHYPVGRLVVPFFRTPVNLADYGIQRTPGLQFAHAQFLADLKAGGAKADLAKAKVGTAAMTAAVFTTLAASGKITGGAPKDPTLRGIFLLEHPEYSIQLLGKWHSYNRLDPAFMPFGVMADFAQIAGHLPEWGAAELANAIVLSLKTSVTSKTQTIGLANFLDAMSGDVSKSRALANSWARSTVPAAVRQMARYGMPELSPSGVWVVVPGDRTMHETRTLMDQVITGVPVWSRSKTTTHDLFGNPRLLTGGMGPDFASPIYQKDVTDDPVVNEMYRSEVQISPVPPYIWGSRPKGQGLPVMDDPKPSEGIRLTPEQQSRFEVLAGEGLHDALEKTFESPLYKSPVYTDEMRRTIIRIEVYARRRAAEAKLIQEYDDLPVKMRDKATERVQALTTRPVGGGNNGRIGIAP